MPNPHPAAATAAAARRFLEGLDDAQRPVAVVSFDDEATRRDWHYVPRERAGLALAAMTAPQQKAAIDLFATGFSLDGFAAACLVMALEDPLDRIEGGSGARRLPAEGRMWGRHRAEYNVLCFGEPGDDAWGWRFEGHHVSVTVTVVDGRCVTVPHFLGANPAEVAAIRILPREEDLAFALLDAMTAAERRQAVVDGVAPDDILTTNAPALDVLPPAEGVVLGDLGAPARAAAEALVGVYLAREPHPRSVDLESLRFAFAGERAHRRPHYYRVQGDDLLVEYDNTQNDANHVHTVVRTPGGDFGDDLLRAHLATAHE